MVIKYTSEITDLLKTLYVEQKASVPEICQVLSEKVGEPVPPRSVISKLSALGVYQKKGYVSKLGYPPVKKSALVEQLAELIHMDYEVAASLEKVNKNVLTAIIKELT